MINGQPYRDGLRALRIWPEVWVSWTSVCAVARMTGPDWCQLQPCMVGSAGADPRGHGQGWFMTLQSRLPLALGTASSIFWVELSTKNE